MNRTQKTMRNSITGLAGQIITILLSIIARKVFIQCIGVELLGLNSTFASILSTLSLAELGFQQVIVFHLYGSLAKGDQKQVNSLVNVYRVVYRCIGCFFIVASLCCVPFLQVFLSDIEATPSVRIYFLIQAFSGACTYFLAYKRNILYADQQSYVSALIDTVINTSATLICIVVVLFTHSYLLYLIINLVKTYLSNLLVHRVCAKRYPYLHSERVDWKLLKSIAINLKDVVLERLAGYIYGSTDNLIISAFISTVQVGFLNNYTLIFTHIKSLIRSLSTPLIPALGNKVAIEQRGSQQMNTFSLLEQLYFWLAGMAVIPTYVLADSFIGMFFGERFVLSGTILFLLCIDLYIHINQDVCLSFLSANGLFRKQRNISIGGAIINIVVSLLLMKPLGIAGILAGTAVSQVYYWVARSVVALRECLNQSWRTLAFYWMKQLGFFAVITAAVWISSALTQQLFVLNGIVTFIINGIISESCFVLLALICCRGIPAQRQLESIMLGLLKKCLRRGKTLGQ